MSQPWDKPLPPADFNIGDHPGEVVLVILGGYHDSVPTRSYGAKPAVRCTVVVLTGRSAGQVFDDVMFFARRLVSQFQGAQSGHVVLGRVMKNDKAVHIDAPSSYDEQVAGTWLNQQAPGTLDALRTAAVRRYAEEQAKMVANPLSTSVAVAPSPQFQPTTGAAMGHASPQAAQGYAAPQGGAQYQQPQNGGQGPAQGAVAAPPAGEHDIPPALSGNEYVLGRPAAPGEIAAPF